MTDDRILYLIALPIILILVFGEFWYRKRKNDARNKLTNLSSNLLCGLIDRLFFLFFGVLQFEWMTALSNYAFFNPISDRFINGIAVFIVVDFVWYLYHRTAHSFKLFWAFHTTHHQTDDFNFSLGLRVSFLQQIIRTFFWLPIVFLGFDPLIILIAIFFQSFYQFFIHTELFDFPVLSRFLFVSPKFHKLHHSNQKKHSNKNFGGVLTIWDRLFGSFESPYNQKNIALKTTDQNNELSPFNAYFSPFLGLLKQKETAMSVGNSAQENYGKRLFVVFITFLIPSLGLIILSDKMNFNTILISSLTFIGLAFLIAHLSLKNVK